MSGRKGSSAHKRLIRKATKRLKDFTYFAVAIEVERFVRRRSDNLVLRGMAYVSFPFLFGGFLGLSPRIFGLWNGTIIVLAGLLWLFCSVCIWACIANEDAESETDPDHE